MITAELEEQLRQQYFADEGIGGGRGTFPDVALDCPFKSGHWLTPFKYERVL
jgi:hypothetical protein